MESEAVPENTDNGLSIRDHVLRLINSPFSLEIDAKIAEFNRFLSAPSSEIFGELCFCLLTANTSAEMGVRTQEIIGLDNFINMDEKKLRDALKASKYRFYNLRSGFIANSRWIIPELPDLIKSKDTFETREYLVENIKGLGYKESSHFLRNVGIFDFAILDKHILRMLQSENPKIQINVASRKNYLATEETILEMAREMGLRPGVLDLYMWKVATGKLIK